MSRKTKPDDLAKAVSQVLEEYRDATQEVVQKAVDKVSKESVDELKTDSPKRTGAYSKDWAAKVENQTNKWAYKKIVYNKKHYRLTHLLEKKHRLRNGSMSKAQPHIAPVEQKAVENLTKYIKEGV